MSSSENQTPWPRIRRRTPEEAAAYRQGYLQALRDVRYQTEQLAGAIALASVDEVTT